MRAGGIVVVVTGRSWLGRGFPSIETSLRRLFLEAEDEVLLTAYSISRNADLFFDLVENALGRGITVKAVVNRFRRQPRSVKERLEQVAKNYLHLELFSFDGDDQDDLHAKVVVVDRRRAIIGSSNFSTRGLLTNHEIAVELEGSDAARVASAFDRLARGSDVTAVRFQ